MDMKSLFAEACAALMLHTSVTCIPLTYVLLIQGQSNGDAGAKRCELPLHGLSRSEPVVRAAARSTTSRVNQRCPVHGWVAGRMPVPWPLQRQCACTSPAGAARSKAHECVRTNSETSDVESRRAMMAVETMARARQARLASHGGSANGQAKEVLPRW
ncbi:hypothetical protein DPSP01_007360 [Paraphaeosphaeria sporulosa]